MFDFLKLLPGEDKETYKKRIGETIKSILKDINGDKERLINLISLLYCVNNNLTKEEKKLANGDASDYESYIMARLLNNLNEDKFLKVKQEVEQLIINDHFSYNDLINNCKKKKYEEIEENLGYQ